MSNYVIIQLLFLYQYIPYNINELKAQNYYYEKEFVKLACWKIL